MKHLRFLVLVLVLLALSGLGLGFNGTAQEGEGGEALTPAALDQILAETNAAETISNLAQVLIGPEEFDEKMIAYGVLLKIAQETAFPELDLKGWFKANFGREIKQTDLTRFDLVRRALKTHPDLYKQLQEELAQLAPTPSETEAEAGGTSPGGGTTTAMAPELAQLTRQFKEFSDRLAALEERVSQLLPGNGETNELAQLRQEVEQLKTQLPDPQTLQELEGLSPRLQGLEERVSQMNGSLGGLRGLVLFLLVLVILMLIWIIYLRVRELSRSLR